MSNEIQTIVKWFSDAKPNPTIEDIATQYGCHLEEFAEGLEVTDDGDTRVEALKASESYKVGYSHYIDAMEATLSIDCHRVEMLDALCDQIVTAVGVAQYMGFDIVGALNEVIASNDSKRMPDGSFPLDENSKITKESPNFFKPDLSEFIGGNND